MTAGERRRGRRVTLPELVHHLSQASIAKFKLPERGELVDELPLSPFGKVSLADSPSRSPRCQEAVSMFMKGAELARRTERVTEKGLL